MSLPTSLKNISGFVRIQTRPAVSTPVYTVYTGTMNLGATFRKTGHPTLKHCFAAVMDQNRQVVATYAFGRKGLQPEKYLRVPSAYSEPAAYLTEEQYRNFDHAIRAQTAQPYDWYKNNCCSCIEQALIRGAGVKVPTLISNASRAIQSVPEVF